MGCFLSGLLSEGLGVVDSGLALESLLRKWVWAFDGLITTSSTTKRVLFGGF